MFYGGVYQINSKNVLSKIDKVNDCYIYEHQCAYGQRVVQCIRKCLIKTFLDFYTFGSL
jgi:hypothetical protein